MAYLHAARTKRSVPSRETAPNIAGKDVVNPCSLILSAVMMLEYFGWQEAADVIEKALEESFADGRATNDLARFMPGGKALPTSVFAKEITEKIQKK
jgi:isocitrate dehydrogenase